MESSPIGSSTISLGGLLHCVQLCIETPWKQATSVAYLTNFFFEFVMQFSHKMPLYFFIPLCKKVKNDQKLKSRGPASRLSFCQCYSQFYEQSSIICRMIKLCFSEIYSRWVFSLHVWLCNPLQTRFVLDLDLKIKFIFVLRRKGSRTKERMKEEEKEKGDCGPPTRKDFFWDFVRLEQSGT